MEADHKAAAHVAAVWRETYPAGSTQSNIGAAYQEALTALGALTDRHVALISSGDCGFWDAEKEREVIEARAILTAAGR